MYATRASKSRRTTTCGSHHPLDSEEPSFVQPYLPHNVLTLRLPCSQSSPRIAFGSVTLHLVLSDQVAQLFKQLVWETFRLILRQPMSSLVKPKGVARPGFVGCQSYRGQPSFGWYEGSYPSMGRRCVVSFHGFACTIAARSLDQLHLLNGQTTRMGME